ncbi:MAG: hypothetical protein ACK4WF_02085 [Candidatus Brocadiales bacterium]
MVRRKHTRVPVGSSLTTFNPFSSLEIRLRQTVARRAVPLHAYYFFCFL